MTFNIQSTNNKNKRGTSQTQHFRHTSLSLSLSLLFQTPPPHIALPPPSPHKNRKDPQDSSRGWARLRPRGDAIRLGKSSLARSPQVGSFRSLLLPSTFSLFFSFFLCNSAFIHFVVFPFYTFLFCSFYFPSLAQSSPHFLPCSPFPLFLLTLIIILIPPIPL